MWLRPFALSRFVRWCCLWAVARGASTRPAIHPVRGPASWPTPNLLAMPLGRSEQMRRLASALPSRPHKRKHQRVWVK